MTLTVGGARQFWDKSYFTVASANGLNFGTGDFLLSAWVYRDATGNQVIVAKRQDATTYWKLEITAGHKAHFQCVMSGTTQIEVTGASNVSTTSTWYHIAVAVDRSGTAGCKIYVDGVDDTSGTPTTSVNSIDNTGSLYVGTLGDETLHWRGRISCLCVAKPADVTSIVAAAVASLYNAGGSKYYGDLTSSEKSSWNVTAFWNCNEGNASDVLYDQHGSSDGTKTFDNMISNAGFETAGGGDPDFWADWTETGVNVTFSIESASPYAGAASSKLTTTAASASGWLSQDCGLTAGREYAASIVMKANDNIVASIGIGSTGIQAFNVTTSWETHQVTTTCAGVALFYCSWVYNPGNGKILYCDSVSCKATSIPSVDGPASRTAPTDGDPILSWSSSHSDASSFAQATAAKRPTYNYGAIHGRSTLIFDGTDDYVRVASSLDTTTLGSLAIVFKTGATSFSADQALFASADEAAANVYFEVGIDSAGKCFVEVNDSGTVHRVTGSTVLANSTSYLLIVRSTGTTWDMSVNGTTQTLTVTGSNSGKWLGDLAGRDGCTLGALVASSTTDYFEGEVAECVLYSDRLSDADNISLETYVSDRYDIGMA